MLGAVDWLAAVGRLHPLLLHLPIGLLVALCAVEALRRARGRTEVDASRGVLVSLLALTAFLAALTGWLLHESDDYGDPVDLHEWLGIALMAVCAVIAVAHCRRSPRFGAWLALGALLLVPTAHYGASLTHGADYLLEPWRSAERTAPVASDDADPFAAAEPFFAEYCTKCHGDAKRKGGLALHDFAALLAGGEGGPVVVQGDPDASEVIARLRLPLDDDDHMPPDGKRQPSAEEVDALSTWIAALDGAGGAEVEIVLALPEGPVDVAAPPGEERDAEAARAAVAQLQGRLVHVAPLFADADLLHVAFGACALEPGELRSLLAPLAAQVAELDLSGQALAPDDLAFVAELPHLERLDLRRLRVGTLDLAPLAGNESLAWLNLAGTRAAPSSESALSRLPALRTVHVWRTGLDVERLASARPDLTVHGASSEPDAPLEVEPEVAFHRLADESAAREGLRATNAACPITGKPVDPRYTILFEGRAIGFCCPNCPANFWSEQEAQREDR